MWVSGAVFLLCSRKPNGYSAKSVLGELSFKFDPRQGCGPPSYATISAIKREKNIFTGSLPCTQGRTSELQDIAQQSVMHFTFCILYVCFRL